MREKCPIEQMYLLGCSVSSCVGLRQLTKLLFDNHLNTQQPNKVTITQGISALIPQRKRRRTKAESTTRLVIAFATSVMYSHRGFRSMDSRSLPFLLVDFFAFSKPLRRAGYFDPALSDNHLFFRPFVL